MVFKMAFKNIIKSYKDYSIYFVTLVASIVIFYITNALATSIATKIFRNKDNMQAFTNILNTIMFVITLTMLFLMIYANQFIMKRRYKELALYTLFGLSKRKVIQIISLETIFIGVLSLVFGLMIGSILSQFINHFALSFLFKGQKFELVFNPNVVQNTILIFMIIFLITIIFNAVVIIKSQLIQLLQKENAVGKIFKIHPFIACICMVISIAMFGYLYYLLLRKYDVESIKLVLPIIIIGVINTFLFFFAISGLIAFVFKMNRKLFYRHIHSYTISILIQKLRTHFISLSIVSLLMFFGISAATFGGSLYHSSMEVMQFFEGFDVKVNPKNTAFNEEIAKQYGLTLKQKTTYDITNIQLGDFSIPMMVLPLSRYNTLTNQNIVLNNQIGYAPTPHHLLNEEMLPYFKKIDHHIEKFVQVNRIHVSTDYFFVMEDALYQKLNIAHSQTVYYFDDHKETFMDDEMSLKLEKDFGYNMEVVFASSERTRGMTAQILLMIIAIYISTVLVISGITMIALQQLSSAKDNMKHYRMMNDLGAGKTMIKKSVIWQVGLYFFIPLIFGLTNSYVAMRFVSEAYRHATNKTLIQYVGSIFFIISILYLVYGWITFYSYYKTVYQTHQK